MNRSALRRHLLPWAAASVIGLLALAGLAGGYWTLHRMNGPTGPRPPVDRTGMDLLPEGSYPADSLPPGTMAPPLEAAGWINGPPPTPGPHGPRLVVLDLWADWCPMCRQIAPDLVRLHRKYKGNGVAFVSLTPDRKEGATSFVDQFAVPWPCGYGVTRETVATFGAYDAERIANYFDALNQARRRDPDAPPTGVALLPEAARPKYELSPTFYVIGRDGRVLWHDDHARPRHLRTVPELAQDIEAAIERGLAVEEPAKGK